MGTIETSHPLDLSNPAMVELLLRTLADQIIALHAERMRGVSVQQTCKKEFAAIEHLAEILLGENETYLPVPEWNGPGFIDVNLAGRFNLRDRKPKLRLCAFLLWFVSKVHTARWKTPDLSAMGGFSDFDAVVLWFRDALLGPCPGKF